MHFGSLRPNPVSLFTLRGGRWSRWLLLAFLPPPDPQQSRWEGGGSCWIAGIVSVFSSVQFSRSVVSDSLRLHGPQHARLPCPSPTPGAYSNTCPSSRWYHPTISSSVVLFSSCLQSFPASGSFPMSQFIASDGQSIGVPTLVSVLPVKLHSHLEARNWWQLWHFLPTDVTGDISFHTISQYSALQAYGHSLLSHSSRPHQSYISSTWRSLLFIHGGCPGALPTALPSGGIPSPLSFKIVLERGCHQQPPTLSWHVHAESVFP